MILRVGIGTLAAVLIAAPLPVGSGGPGASEKAAKAPAQPEHSMSMNVDQCAVDVLPAEMQLQLKLSSGATETVRLSSVKLPHAVVSRQPGFETELVALSLQGVSRLVGPIRLMVGRQFGLEASMGHIVRPPGEQIDSFFDITYRLDFPALGQQTMGFARAVQATRTLTHFVLAAAVIVEHPGKRCNTGRLGTGRCDIDDTTCWEYFDAAGNHKGCSS